MADPIRLLHVEDDPAFAEVAAQFLEREDDRLEVVTETSAADGLQRLGENDVDCIVSDYQMPHKDGLAFLREVRGEHPELPFLLFTGEGSEEVASEAIAAGATGYLQKGTGTEQYELLANRVLNAVEQYRSKRRAANLERVRTLASDVNQALVRATSREDIEARVCDVIAGAEPYRFVVCADVDAETNRIEPRASAGTESGFPDGVELSVGEAAAARHAPGGRAFHEREIEVVQDLGEDPADGPWRELALEHGFEALAVVPLAHDDTVYGLLAVFTDRPDAFDETERELLVELGDDIGHALHAQAVKRDLRESKERFQALFENAPGPVIAGEVCEGGDRHVIREVNEAFEAVFGFDAEEVTGLDIGDVLVPDAGWDQHASFREQAAAGKPFAAEVERQTAGGAREFLLDGIPFGLDDGVADGWFAWYTEITDRVQREQRLQERQALFEALLETSLDGILVVDDEREYVTWNQQFIDMWRVPESLIGDRPEDQGLEWALDQLEQPEEFMAQVEYLYEHPEEESRDELRLTDGRVFDRYFAPVQGSDGTHLGRVWFFRDVTERKERERALARERNRFEAIFEAVPEPSVHVVFEDGDPVIQRTNDAFERVFGYAPDEAEGESVDDLIVPADRQDDARDINEAVSETGDLQVEVERQTDDGVRPFLFTAKTMTVGDGDEIHVEGVGTYVDLANQKRREDELVRQNERLEEFASVVSHDLRNPLSVAKGRLELARDELDSEHLEPMAHALDRMERIIEDVLWLASEGRDIGETDTVDLDGAIEDAWRIAADEAAEAELVVEGGGGALGTIAADYDRLCQLLENLLDNAVTHGAAGGPASFDDAADGVCVTVGRLEDGFYVEDDGTGIPAGERDDVFEAGYSTSDEGTGFGLAIVKQVVEAHGWDVAITAAGDGGARFEVTGVEEPDGSAG